MLSDDVETSGGWALGALTDLAMGGAERERSSALLERLTAPHELRVTRSTLSRRRTIMGTGYRTLAEVASAGSLVLSVDRSTVTLHGTRFRSEFGEQALRSGGLMLTSVTAALTEPTSGRARWSDDGTSLTAKFTTGLSLRATARALAQTDEQGAVLPAELVLWPERLADVSAVLVVRAADSGVLEARLRFTRQGLLLRAFGGREPRCLQLSIEADDGLR